MEAFARTGLFAFFQFSVSPQYVCGNHIAAVLAKTNTYLQDGRLRPDNNLVENAIRPFVVGRKNWLFSGHPCGAEASAFLYSLIETAKAKGFKPYAYLRFLFDQLPLANSEEDYRNLLPAYLDASRLNPVTA
jgi:hypothetical protein